jgi:DNA-binding HxlR family transcriptional regulator
MSDRARRGRAAGPRSTCPIAGALDVIGDRWTLLVVRDLVGGKNRFSEFVASDERIPSNVLADRVRRLGSTASTHPVPSTA